MIQNKLISNQCQLILEQSIRKKSKSKKMSQTANNPQILELLSKKMIKSKFQRLKIPPKKKMSLFLRKESLHRKFQLMSRKRLLKLRTKIFNVFLKRLKSCPMKLLIQLLKLRNKIMSDLSIFLKKSNYQENFLIYFLKDRHFIIYFFYLPKIYFYSFYFI